MVKTAHFNSFFFFNVYLFLGQRETERGRGRERGRHRIGNRLQVLRHQPRAQRGARTHGPRDSDLAEVGRLTDCATQAPRGRSGLKVMESRLKSRALRRVSIINSLLLVGLVYEFSNGFSSYKEGLRMCVRPIFTLNQH